MTAHRMCILSGASPNYPHPTIEKPVGKFINYPRTIRMVFTTWTVEISIQSHELLVQLSVATQAIKQRQRHHFGPIFAVLALDKEKYLANS
jgi:hypothetical protein